MGVENCSDDSAEIFSLILQLYFGNSRFPFLFRPRNVRIISAFLRLRRCGESENDHNYTQTRSKKKKK